MKTITTAAQNVHHQTEGAEPFVIVEVAWPAPVGTKYYGDKTIVVGALTIDGRIEEVSPVNALVGQDMQGSVSSVSISLIDNDLVLQGHLEQAPLVEALVRVLLLAEGLTVGDEVELISGKAARVEWVEETRSLQFDVVSAVTSEKVGHTPTTAEIPELPTDAVDQPWPVAFGSVEDVPCVIAKDSPRTVLINDVESSDDELDVENADDFPTTACYLKVDGEIILGSFSGDTFNVTTRNVTKYSNILTDSRPGGHADAGNPYVLWLDSSDLDVVGYHFICTDIPGYGTAANARRVNFCVAQKGNRCVFKEPWTNNKDDVWLVGNNVTMDVQRFAWQWTEGSAGFSNSGAWVLKAGATVTQYGNEDQTWVASEIEAGQVKRVRAFRSYQRNVAGLESRRLVTVPANYYTVNEDNSSLVSGKTCCTIRFPVALSQLNQGWEDDQIFATVASTVGSNVADIIQYILEEYTSLSVDADSFLTARTALTKYPAHCAIQDGPDAIQVCNDIAFQARCALSVIGSTAYLRYLSTEPSGPDAIVLTPSNVREASAKTTETDTANVYTVITGEWMKKLSEPSTRPKPRTKQESQNTNIFGKREYVREFWIFRKGALVRKSVEFWAARFSHVWRQVSVAGYLPLLSAEPWDVVRINLPDVISPSPVDGWIQEVQVSTAPYGVAMLIWTPVVAGTSVAATGAYDDDSGDTVPIDPTTGISAGPREIARITPWDFGLTSEPFQEAVFYNVVKVIKSSTTYASMQEGVIALYPRGYSYPSTGTAFCYFVNQWHGSPHKLTLGGKGTARRAGGGWYVAALISYTPP